MCDKIRSLDGKIYPHEHNVVLVYLPEEPDKEDWKILKKTFPGENVRYIVDKEEQIIKKLVDEVKVDLEIAKEELKEKFRTNIWTK